jgi:two-component system, NtrC family, sensor kinase
MENMNSARQPESIRPSILAVDDDVNILEITEMILEKEGYSVRLAQTAQDALQVIQREKIDLVLLDIMLPDADGYWLCQHIRNNEETRDIPVILLTSLDGVDNKVRGLDVGASDYLVKPFLQRELLARIRSHLREHQFAQEVKSLYSLEKQRTRELKILNKLITGFNTLVEQDALLAHAARIISTELNLYGCIIAIRDENENRFRVKASYRSSNETQLEGLAFSLNEGLMGWVAANSTPLVVPDVNRNHDFTPYFPETRSEMAVPLTYQDRVMGVLSVQSIQPHAYSTENIDLLRTVAGNLSLALKNAELYSAAKLYSEGLESTVDQRTQELEDQKRLMECIIDSLPIGLYVVNQKYSVVAWNRKRETGILGISRDRVIGQNIFSTLSKMDRQKLKGEFDHVFDSGNTFETETVSWSSGEKRYYHLRKIPMSLERNEITHVITLGEDITERKRMEESLFTNEKLASIGKLAAGIAHEINNPLAAIAGCVEGLISRSKDDELVNVRAFEDFPEYLRIIDDEIGRCKGIINNLLEFSRTRELLQQEISIKDTLRQTLQLLSHHKAFKLITVIEELDATCPPVIGNGGELRQVFLAMAINAVEAMNESGTLTIRTGTELRNDQTFVWVEFQDTGVGIPPQNLNKIFDPFFTTKPVGKGTGLGLSICYGIVRTHGGFIKVTSEEGKGSLFQIYIPATPLREQVSRV